MAGGKEKNEDSTRNPGLMGDSVIVRGFVISGNFPREAKTVLYDIESCDLQINVRAPSISGNSSHVSPFHSTILPIYAHKKFAGS